MPYLGISKVTGKSASDGYRHNILYVRIQCVVFVFARDGGG
jgi:hypothetical protein